MSYEVKELKERIETLREALNQSCDNYAALRTSVDVIVDQIDRFGCACIESPEVKTALRSLRKEPRSLAHLRVHRPEIRC